MEVKLKIELNGEQLHALHETFRDEISRVMRMHDEDLNEVQKVVDSLRQQLSDAKQHADDLKSQHFALAKAVHDWQNGDACNDVEIDRMVRDTLGPLPDRFDPRNVPPTRKAGIWDIPNVSEQTLEAARDEMRKAAMTLPVDNRLPKRPGGPIDTGITHVHTNIATPPGRPGVGKTGPVTEWPEPEADGPAKSWIDDVPLSEVEKKRQAELTYNKVRERVDEYVNEKFTIIEGDLHRVGVIAATGAPAVTDAPSLSEQDCACLDRVLQYVEVLRQSNLDMRRQYEGESESFVNLMKTVRERADTGGRRIEHAPSACDAIVALIDAAYPPN